MSRDRSLLERQMADLELRPFTIDEFHRRRRRAQRNRRARTMVMGVALAVAVVGGAFTVTGKSTQRISTADGPVPDPPSPYVGTWLSTDLDGSSQTLEIREVGPNAFDVVIHDEEATQACAGAPVTMTGTGHVERGTTLVVAADASCDDGSVPTPVTDPAVAEDFAALLARMELHLNTVTDELFGLDVVWRRAAPDGTLDVMKLSDADALPPGRYSIDPDGDEATPLRVTFEVAADGWQPWIGAVKPSGDGDVWLSITTVENLVRDACRDQRPANPPIGGTVDDLATALAGLAPFEVSSAARDVEAFGYRGKHLAWTVPALPVTGEGSDRLFSECPMGRLRSWISPTLGDSFYGYNGEPGRTEEFWILDVDGTRLVLALNIAPASVAADVAELRAIFDSIQIEA